jgi:hypothetical protein
MEKNLINVQLSVEVKNETVLAHLSFQNKSGKNIYLNKQVMYHGGFVRNNYFKIENSNGMKTRYLGMMANCTRMPDEYLQLGSEEIIKSTISLKEAYELKEGENYQIQYYAYNPSYLEEQRITKMQSNKVEISY